MTTIAETIFNKYLAWEEGDGFLDWNAIASDLNCSIEEVRAAIRELEEEGVIELCEEGT